MSNRSVMAPLVAVVINLLILLPAYALTSVQMVKDINPALLDASFSSPDNLVEMNGIVYFTATDPAHGSGLWRSDGTAAGTRLVKRLTCNGLTNVNGTLYCSGYEYGYDQTGEELWKSDGTEAGTVLVKDIDPSGSSFPHNFTNVNGTLFFKATDPAHGKELWKSDGTEAGTVLVKDIYPGVTGSDPYYLTSVNGTLFFMATNQTNGAELWKSDGTEAGTVLVKDIYPGGYSSYPNNFTSVNGTLFFTATNSANGIELWKSDGTTGGTVLVKDIYSAAGVGSNPNDLTNVNGTLFFTASSPTTGRELWKSDGTVSGTVLVKDFAAGTADGFYDSGYSSNNFTNVNGTLFFSLYGSGLWKSDGTEAGTVLVKGDFGTYCSGYQRTFAYVNGQLYICGGTYAFGAELWKSDGTTAGTVLVKDIVPGSMADSTAYNSSPRNFTTVNGTLYFIASSDATGTTRLWKSDGTTAGTAMIVDNNPGTGDTDFSSLTDVNGTLFFSASDPTHGSGLWKSDSTEAGTVQLNPGTAFAPLKQLTNVNGTLFFSAYDQTNGQELWRSDGTTGGTRLVKDLFPGTWFNSYNNMYWPFSTDPLDFVNLNGTLYFTANDMASQPNTPASLFKSDGTADGTVVVKGISSSFDYAKLYGLINVNGTLFFVGHDATTGHELWKSDGTTAGTMLVKDINPGVAGAFSLIDSNYYSSSNPPYYFTNVNGILFFIAQDPTNGESLWKSDGTSAGTVLLKAGVTYTTLANVNGMLFFRGYDPANGWELWKSDGTTAGTVLVKDIYPGLYSYSPNSSYPDNLVNVNGTLLFTAYAGAGPYCQLWKSDGTDAGTTMLRAFSPDEDGNCPAFTPFNNRVYFSAYDSTFGTDLWQSDGTESGTVMTADIYPGSGSSRPQNLTASSDALYFSAHTREYGRELMKLTVSPLLSLASHDFGTVTIGNSVTRTLTLKNIENTPLNVSAIQFVTSDSAQFSFNRGNGSNGTCGATPVLGHNQSCTMEITFAPTTEGFFSATVQVASDDPQNPLVEATLSGSTPIGDKTPPETTITSAPANGSYAGPVIFSFESSEEGSTFQCNRTGSSWSDCTSPDYSGIGYGSCVNCRLDTTQTFSVRAIDAAGNVDPTPASHTWTSFHDVNVPFASVLDGGEVQFPEVELIGDVLLNRAVTFTLRGGYDWSYTARNGHTFLKGVVTISAGTLIVDGITIK